MSDITNREKALREALDEIARICRNCHGQPETYAFTVGLVGSMAREAVRTAEFHLPRETA